MSHRAEKFRRGTLLCCRKFLVSKNVKEKREREGALRLSLQNLLSHRTEQLRRRNLCFKNFLVSKNVKDKRGGGASRISVENLLSHSTEKLRRGHLCFRKFLVSKNVKDIRERGASRLSIENLLSHNTEKLRRGNLCFRKVLVSKNVKDKRERGHHDFPSKLCCLTVPKNFVGETCVSENFWYRKMLRIREREREREGGASRLSLENLLSHRTEQLRRGNLCFRKFLVSENVKDKRERGHHDFPSKHCCLTVPKIFVGETCVSESFWYRKMLGIRERGGHHDFPSKICCLTIPKNFVWVTCVSEKFWYRKMLRMRERGGHHDFPSKICCLTVPSNFVGETCVSKIFWYRKMLRIREGGGGITNFCRKFIVSQYRKTSSGTLVFQKVSGIEKC